MREGWVSIYREIQGHWIWQDAQKLKQWLDILLNVNSVDGRVNLGLGVYDCKRGQSLISIQGWADRWRVSKSAARAFLLLLEKDGLISMESIQKSTRLTVCEYDSYQNCTHDKKPVKKQPKEAPENDISFVDSRYLPAWDAWLKHKASKHQKYASIDTLKIAYKKLLKYSENDPEKALLLIIDAIGNNYAGFFAYKPSMGQPGTSASKAENLINQNARLKQMFAFQSKAS